jgi:hypothetical protein
MNRHILMAGIAILSGIAISPAAAAPGGAKAGAKAGATVGADKAAKDPLAPIDVKSTVKADVDPRPKADIDAGANSQGAANASVSGLANASENSALADAGRTDLGTIATGTHVTGAAGADIGTVTKVVTNRSGAVIGLEVDLAGGGKATIPASSLSLTGSVLTSTWVQK